MVPLRTKGRFALDDALANEQMVKFWAADEELKDTGDAK